MARSTGTALRRLARRSSARPASGDARGPWSVPLLVDGRRRRLTGELVRGRRPAIWTWAAAAALLACAVLALTLFRPASRLRSSLVLAGVAGVAATVTAVGFALDDYASPGTWIASLDELVFVAVGFGVLAWGPPVGMGPSGDRARLALRRRRNQQGRGLSSPDRAVVASRDRRASLRRACRRSRLRRDGARRSLVVDSAGCAASRASISPSQRTLRGPSGAAG